MTIGVQSDVSGTSGRLQLNGGDQLLLINGLAPAPTVGTGRNVKMIVAAASATATITADEFVVKKALGGVFVCMTAVSQALNLATIGIGGMDVGSPPNSGFVAIYGAYNPTTGVMGAFCQAAPATGSGLPEVYGGSNAPSGFTATGLMAVVPTDATGKFQVCSVQGRRTSRSALLFVNSSTINPTLTAVALTGFVPPNAKRIKGYIQTTNNTAGANSSLNISPDASGVALAAHSGNTVTGSNATTSNYEIPLFTPSVAYYTSSNSGGTVIFAVAVTEWEI